MNYCNDQKTNLQWTVDILSLIVYFKISKVWFKLLIICVYLLNIHPLKGLVHDQIQRLRIRPPSQPAFIMNWSDPCLCSLASGKDFHDVKAWVDRITILWIGEVYKDNWGTERPESSQGCVLIFLSCGRTISFFSNEVKHKLCCSSLWFRLI